MKQFLLYLIGFSSIIFSGNSCNGPRALGGSADDVGRIPNYRTIKLLPLLNDAESHVYAINNASPPIAVGSSTNAQGSMKPVFWVLDDMAQVRATALQRDISLPNGEARAVSENGRVAGTGIPLAHDRELPVWWNSLDDFPQRIGVSQTDAPYSSFHALQITDDTVITGKAFKSTTEKCFSYIGRNNHFTVSDLVIVKWGKFGSNFIDRIGAGYRLTGNTGERNMQPLFGLSETSITQNNIGFKRTELTDFIHDTTLGNVIRMRAPGFFDYAESGCAAQIKRPRQPVLYTLLINPDHTVDSSHLILPFINGDSSTWALGMNKDGFVVGGSIHCSTTRAQQHGMIWTSSQGSRDINDFTTASADQISIEENVDINNNKLIAANGKLGNINHAFVLIPEVPNEVNLAKRAPVVVESNDVISYTFTLQNFTASTINAVVKDPIPNGTVFELSLPQTTVWTASGNLAVSNAVNVGAFSSTVIELKLRVTAPAGSQIVDNNYSIEPVGRASQTFNAPVFTQVNSHNNVRIIPVDVPGSDLPGGSGSPHSTSFPGLTCEEYAPNTPVHFKYEIRGTVQEPSSFSIVDIISGRNFFTVALPPFEDSTIIIEQNLFLDAGQYAIAAVLVAGTDRFVSEPKIFNVGISSGSHNYFELVQLFDTAGFAFQPTLINSSKVIGTLYDHPNDHPVIWNIESGRLDTILPQRGYVSSANENGDLLVSNRLVLSNLAAIDSFPKSDTLPYFNADTINITTSAARLLNNNKQYAAILQTNRKADSSLITNNYVGIMGDSLTSASWVNKPILLLDNIVPQIHLLSNTGQLIISQPCCSRPQLTDTLITVTSDTSTDLSHIGGDLVIINDGPTNFRVLTPDYKQGEVRIDTVLQSERLTPLGNKNPAIVNGINDLGFFVGAVGYYEPSLISLNTAIQGDLQQAVWYAPIGSDTVLVRSLQGRGILGVANDINNLGNVVGTFNNSNVLAGDGGIFSVEQLDSASINICGTFYNLNDFIPLNSGVTLHSAVAINERNYILAHGTFNGSFHYYILQPRNRRQP